MILRRRAFISTALAAMVLATTIPVLTALGTMPDAVFGGRDVYIIPQGDHGRAINASLIDGLRRQPWVEGVSPEVYAPVEGGGQPVVVRGIDPGGFASVEPLRVLEGTWPGKDFALAGRRLASRLGLGVGSPLVLTGTTVPAVAEVTVTAIATTGGASDDELLVPLGMASWLATQGSNGLTLVRVRTQDPGALERFLAAVGSPRTTAAPVDDRAGSVALLDPGLAPAVGRPYLATLALYGSDTVRLVVGGFVILSYALVGLGQASSLARDLDEAAPRLGLLKALGMTRRQVVGLLVRELLLLALPGALAGTLLGRGLASLLGPPGAMTVFGYTLIPEGGAWALLQSTGAVAGLVTALALGLLGNTWRRPAASLLGPSEEGPQGVGA